MSKYDKLWEYVSERNEDSLELTYDEIREYGGVPIDHSFLKFKKELRDYGYEVEKISMKKETVKFRKQR